MNKFFKFRSDDSGNIAMMAAILLIPIMTAIGSTIDYTNYVRQKNNIQHSLDAAGLAAGAELTSYVGDDDQLLATLEDVGTKFFETNLKNQVDSEDYTLYFNYYPGNALANPPTPDRVELSVDFNYPTVFGAFIGVETLEDTIASQISLGNRTVEVAMVLDNSGSMGSYPSNTSGSEKKIDTLKTASASLVDTIFGSASLVTLPDPVKFSLVPFAASVNVGTGNADASWMDIEGRSSIHHENFDWENSYRTSQSITTVGNAVKVGGNYVNRFDVFDMIDVEWSGCVEMRPWPYNVTDDYLSNSAGGDYDKLFVPFFAPDEPDDDFADKYSYNHDDETEYAQNVDHDGDDDDYRNSYLYDFRDADGTQLYARDNAGNIAYGEYDNDDQINRTNWMFKYQADVKIDDDDDELNDYMSSSRGPNYNCTSRPLLELTTNKQTVKTELQNMIASGTTNIQQGLTWGWRTLTESEPFTEGREKGDPKNLKIIILLTDGNNYYRSDGDSTPNRTAYGAWGYARPNDKLHHPISGDNTHNRWADGLSVADRAGTIYETISLDTTPESTGEFEDIMNVHTAQACRNIKADGVSIFSVAFDVPSSGDVRNLMQSCAGSGVINGVNQIPTGTFFFDVSGDDLVTAFENIAQQISQLRISG